jgi:glycosyltransferase involved in cell wall biosynthesis
MQDYSNYHVVYIDDGSPDKTGEFVKKYIEEKNIPKEKIKVIINEKNVFALSNLYTGIT